jgi:hypothetical protein
MNIVLVIGVIACVAGATRATQVIRAKYLTDALQFREERGCFGRVDIENAIDQANRDSDFFRHNQTAFGGKRRGQFCSHADRQDRIEVPAGES